MWNSITIFFIFLTVQVAASVTAFLLDNWQQLQQDNAVETLEMSDVSPGTLVGSIFASSLLTIVLLRLMRLTRKNPFGHLSRQWRTAWLLPVAGILLLSFGMGFLFEPFSLDDAGALADFEQMSHHWLGFVTLVLVGPLAEELVFREGVLRSLAEKGYSPYVALTVSALLFGAVHMNPAQMLPATLLGLVLGWLYLRTGNLLLPVACHVANNFCAFVELRLFGAEQMASGCSLWVSVAVGLLMVLAAIGCLRYWHLKTPSAS